MSDKQTELESKEVPPPSYFSIPSDNTFRPSNFTIIRPNNKFCWIINDETGIKIYSICNSSPVLVAEIQDQLTSTTLVKFQNGLEKLKNIIVANIQKIWQNLEIHPYIPCAIAFTASQYILSNAKKGMWANECREFNNKWVVPFCFVSGTAILYEFWNKINGRDKVRSVVTFSAIGILFATSTHITL